MGISRRVITEPKVEKVEADQRVQVTKALGSAEVPIERPQYNDYIDKVILYIPSEVVAAWLVISGIVAGSIHATSLMINWLIFVSCSSSRHYIYGEQLYPIIKQHLHKSSSQQ